MSPSLHEEGKPHIFLLPNPEDEKKHIRHYSRNEEACEECDLIINTMYEICASRSISKSNIETLSNAMRSKYKYVWESTGRRIVQLSHYFAEAAQLIELLFSDSSSSIRLRTVQSLWSDIPPVELTNRIIIQGLYDKSYSVRVFSAQRIGDLNLVHLKDELIRAKTEETSEKVLQAIDYSLNELKNERTKE